MGRVDYHDDDGGDVGDGHKAIVYFEDPPLLASGRFVCGNLVGALYGEDAIEPTWLAQLELREVIEAMAADLLAEFGPRPPADDRWATRYPKD